MPKIPQKIRLEGSLLILWEICCQKPKRGGLGALKELRPPEVQPRWVAFQLREGLNAWRIPEDGLACHAAVKCVLVADCPEQRKERNVDSSVRDNMIVPVRRLIESDRRLRA